MRGFTTSCLKDEGFVCSRSHLLTMEWTTGKMGSVSLMEMWALDLMNRFFSDLIAFWAGLMKGRLKMMVE